MLTLSATLEAALKRADREPTIAAVIADPLCERVRWTWTSIYGPSGTDGAHAIDKLYSGAILRVRQHPSTGAIDWQKITDPTNATQWDTWTNLATGHSDAAIALASSTTEDRARIFWVDSGNGRTIYMSESTDGSTWGATETVYAEAAPRQVRGLAADMTAGDNHLFYVVDLAAGAPDEVLVSIERTAPATWTNRVQQGLSRYPTAKICAARESSTLTHIYVGDGEGSGGSERRIQQQPFNPSANTWGSGTTTLVFGASTGYDARIPRVHLAASSLNSQARALILYVETRAATYDRPMAVWSPSTTYLPQNTPLPVDSVYGADVVEIGASTYLVYATRAYKHTTYSGAANEKITVSSDVIGWTTSQTAPDRPREARLVLDNSRATYDNAGTSGAALCIRPGAQLAIKVGLRTSAGDEGIWQTPMWIRSVRHALVDRRPVVIIDAEDAWAELERCSSPLTVNLPTNSTIATVLTRALWRVTGSTPSGPAGLAIVLANATFPTTTSFAATVRRLLTLAAAAIRFRSSQAISDGIGFAANTLDLVTLTGTPATSYTYTWGSGHQVLDYDVANALQDRNHTVVRWDATGTTVSESNDHTAIGLIWRRWTRALTDQRIRTTGDANIALDSLLQLEQAQARAGWINVPLQPAQEIADGIALTIPRAGLSATLFRVHGLTHTWRRHPKRDGTTRLYLEAV